MTNSQMYDQIKLPSDTELAGLGSLLDQEIVASTIGQRLTKPSMKISSCAIYYVRYKPGTNCLIAYKARILIGSETKEIYLYAKAYKSSDFPLAVEKARNHRWIEESDLEPVTIAPELQAIFLAFPNDFIIDGLRIMSDPKKIQRILYEHLEEYPEDNWRISDKKLELEIVRYKPERRAVIRCNTKAVHRDSNDRNDISFYMRIYGDDSGQSVFNIHKDIYTLARRSGTFSVPRPIAYIDERKLFLMEALRGRDLIQKLGEDDATLFMTRIAVALSTLHNFNVQGLEAKTLQDSLAEADAGGRMLKSILPDSSRTVDTILQRLDQIGEDRTPKGLVHGDFYYGQVLYEDQGISIIDFDRAVTGDPLMDVGNFIAHLRLLKLQGRISDPTDLERAFFTAYENSAGLKIPSKNLDFWIAYGLFQLAVGPFRSMIHKWPEATVSILEECHRIIES